MDHSCKDTFPAPMLHQSKLVKRRSLAQTDRMNSALCFLSFSSAAFRHKSDALLVLAYQSLSVYVSEEKELINDQAASTPFPKATFILQAQENTKIRNKHDGTEAAN